MPGIQPSEVTELLEHGATLVVLTKGVYEQLRVCPDTLKMLSDRFRHPCWFSSSVSTCCET